MTIVVCGSVHSGTSLVSGTLRLLGKNMGSCDNGRHEDSVVSNGSVESIIDHVRTLDGFKWPILRHDFSLIYPFLKDPKFIYCYRSLCEKARKRKDLYVLTEHLEEGAFWGKFFREQNTLPLVVDFNQSPDSLIRDLVSFLNLTPSEDQVLSSIEFNNKEIGYQTIDRLPL